MFKCHLDIAYHQFSPFNSWFWTVLHYGRNNYYELLVGHFPTSAFPWSLWPLHRSRTLRRTSRRWLALMDTTPLLQSFSLSKMVWETSCQGGHCGAHPRCLVHDFYVNSWLRLGTLAPNWNLCPGKLVWQAGYCAAYRKEGKGKAFAAWPPRSFTFSQSRIADVNIWKVPLAVGKQHI